MYEKGLTSNISLFRIYIDNNKVEEKLSAMRHSSLLSPFCDTCRAKREFFF